jgi:hypothetical protein
MTYILIILGILFATGAVILARKLRRSRQHVGISRPVDITGTVSYKQVIAPGQSTDVSTGIPLQNVEDALAKRPGPPEPGQTFSPGGGPDEPGQNPQPPQGPAP